MHSNRLNFRAASQSTTPTAALPRFDRAKDASTRDLGGGRGYGGSRSGLERLGGQAEHKIGVRGADSRSLVFKAQIAVSLYPSPGDDEVERITKSHRRRTYIQLQHSHQRIAASEEARRYSPKGACSDRSVQTAQAIQDLGRLRLAQVTWSRCCRRLPTIPLRAGLRGCNLGLGDCSAQRRPAPAVPRERASSLGRCIAPLRYQTSRRRSIQPISSRRIEGQRQP